MKTNFLKIGQIQTDCLKSTKKLNQKLEWFWAFTCTSKKGHLVNLCKRDARETSTCPNQLMGGDGGGTGKWW